MVYVLFINRLRLIGFKLVNYITLKALLSPDSTIESAVSSIFLLGLPRLSRLAALLLACLGFSCSNFANKNKRLLAVYLTVSHCTLHLLRAQDFASKVCKSVLFTYAGQFCLALKDKS